MKRGSAAKFREGDAALYGVEIFASGTHRDKPYTPSDLSDMVENFNRFSRGVRPILRVPAVLGHEETQELLERSDLPAAAWATRVYREFSPTQKEPGRYVLRADFVDVPPKVKRLLKGKAYRTVSAEVYDDPPDGVPGHGKMLRRVAFLGGEIPQIKSLDDIPEPVEHRDRAVYRATAIRFKELQARKHAGLFTVFSEVVSMNRDELMAKLAQFGVDTAVLAECPDAALAEMIRVLTEAASTEPQVPEDEAPPERPAETEGMREYASKCKEFPDRMMTRYGASAATNNGDQTVATQATQAAQTMGAGSSSAMQPSQVVLKYSEADVQKLISDQLPKLVDAAVEKIKKPFDEKIANLDKFAEDRIAAEKRATAKARLDVLCQQGKVLPAEREPDDSLDNVAFGLDATTVVRKFKEGGKDVQLTAFDQFFRALEKRPVLMKFTERMKVGGNGTSGNADDEVEKVKEHFARFSEQFQKHGVTSEKLVAGFTAERSRRPQLTAADYLNTN